MHIVIACWIYVIAMVALAMHGALAGVATFLLVGCAPVLLYALLALHRRRSRRAPGNPDADPSANSGSDAGAGARLVHPRATRSGLEHEMHHGNDRDA